MVRHSNVMSNNRKRMSDVIQTAERILGRRLSEEDGLPDSELQKAEIS